MKFNALRTLLPVSLAAILLSGCGASSHMMLAGVAANGMYAAKDAPGPGVDPAPFLATAANCTTLINKSPDWRNAQLVSIEGHGLDSSGKLVPLLGGSWVFKYWANKVQDGQMATEYSLVAVQHHVEGTDEIIDTGDTKATDTVRVLDPGKLSQPTQLVPFAIRLGLKVSHSGPGYNYYDVTYNSFYADPSSADANVADVSAYYQSQVVDMLHIPADAGLLPAPAAAPAPKTAPGPRPAPRRATQTEMAADQQRDHQVMRRQHVN